MGAMAPNWTVEPAEAHEWGITPSMGAAERFARNAVSCVLIDIADRSILCPEMDNYCLSKSGDITSR